jgi:molybdopterin/thiamine biosynthesis adenylyltransferase
MTDSQQQQMIRDAMKAIAERKPGRTKLVYDKTKRTIVAVAAGADAPRALNITADDADMFAVVTLSSAWLRDQWGLLGTQRMVSALFSSWDDGDAYTHCELGPQPGPTIVGGMIVRGEGKLPAEAARLKIVLADGKGLVGQDSTFLAPDGSIHHASAFLLGDGNEQPLEIAFADVQPELAMRRSGLLETQVLKDKTVLFMGLGTGGAYAAIELAKCGVGRFILIDRDRLSVGNVVRHPGGVSQVGRFKVNVVRDLIHEKNPDAHISTYAIELTHENREEIKGLIEQANVVICGTDNRPSKLLLNKLCIEANVPAVYGGAFRRAYGGQVLRVRPKQSPCHECFVAAMPDEASDVEISSATDAAEIAYSDQPIAVEPGLSLDVSPIANMLTKLALLELLADKKTSLSILQRDYDAPWYLWLNRPEPGTQYASLPPLSESSDEMTINRWYGIYFDRDSECPACGDFISALAGAYGLDPASLENLPIASGKDALSGTDI